MMKYLYINGELFNEQGVQKIVVNDTDIIGCNGEFEVFALRGVSFDKITYQIKDELGNVVSPDKTELQILQEMVDQLVIDSLGGV